MRSLLQKFFRQVKTNHFSFLELYINFFKAIWQIGYFYEHGLFVENDLNKAFEYYEKAANSGYDYGLFFSY